jgi:quercetin dioxygenase-like cupin family protein
MSMRELALVSGLSKALISQVERCVANPSLDVIGKLADGLDVRFAALLRSPVAGPQVVRRGEGPTMRSGRVSIRTLFTSTDRSWSEMAEASMPARSKSSEATHREGSVEFAYVVAGSVRVSTSVWDVDLVAGDAIHFDGAADHQYVAGDDGATLLTSVSEPEL